MYSDRFIGFEWFGLAHIGALVTLLIAVFCIFFFRKKLSRETDFLIRRMFAIFLVFLEFNFYYWLLVIEQMPFDVSMLPLGLCAMSVYLTAIMLWTKSERLFKIILPWALSGALISIIVVNMNHTFPHFRYFHYFGNHMIFMLGNLYMLIVHKIKFTYSDLLKSSLILFLITLLMVPINLLLDANHLFLRELPSGTEVLYGFLGDFWVIGFVFSIFLLFHLLFIPIFITVKYLSNENG